MRPARSDRVYMGLLGLLLPVSLHVSRAVNSICKTNAAARLPVTIFVTLCHCPPSVASAGKGSPFPSNDGRATKRNATQNERKKTQNTPYWLPRPFRSNPRPRSSDAANGKNLSPTQHDKTGRPASAVGKLKFGTRKGADVCTHETICSSYREGELRVP